MARMETLSLQVGLANAWLVQPGDTVVLGYPRSLDMASAAEIRERLAARLPGVEIVIIDDIAHMAVYRPAKNPEAT